MVIIFLLLIVGGLCFFSQPDPQVQVSLDHPLKITEQTTTPTVTDSVEPIVVDGNAILELDDFSVEEDDFASLPPVVTNHIATVGSSDDGQRVVVPSEMVDALIEGDSASSSSGN